MSNEKKIAKLTFWDVQIELPSEAMRIVDLTMSYTPAAVPE